MMYGDFPKPRLVISRCINRDPVRYNGGIVTDEFVARVEKYTDCIYVCPEVEVGMGVPRNPVVLVEIDKEIKMIDPHTQKDYTQSMVSFSEKFLSGIDYVDGFILKSKSPSCGVMDTKLYSGDFKIVKAKTDGIFASYVKKRLQLAAVEDEGRLRDFWIRRNFLTKIFSIADFRIFKSRVREISQLVEFHSRYKYLLMLYSQSDLKNMGRIVAEWKTNGFKKTIDEYEKYFFKAFSKKQTLKSNINIFSHIYGYFSKKLNSKERRHFKNMLEAVINERLSVTVMFEFLKSFVYRFENEYLMYQRYLFPFPDDLE